MKIVYSDQKTGKTAQWRCRRRAEAMLIGRKIGETDRRLAIGLSGFKLKITGLQRQDGLAVRKEHTRAAGRS